MAVMRFDGAAHTRSKMQVKAKAAVAETPRGGESTADRANLGTRAVLKTSGVKSTPPGTTPVGPERVMRGDPGRSA